MFLESRYLNHPYDRIWVESERLGITAAAHSTPGLRNPEWTKSGGPGRAAAAAGKRAPPPPASAGYTRRSLIFSKKGPCDEAIGRPILPDLPFDADSLSGKSDFARLYCLLLRGTAGIHLPPAASQERTVARANERAQKPGTWPVWLGEAPTDVAQLEVLLAPYPSEKMIC
jgi:hypothetical protein